MFVPRLVPYRSRRFPDGPKFASVTTKAIRQHTVCGITSLSVEEASADRLLELTRDHWGIENGLHYKRDVTMGEDQSRVRKGAAPQVTAALRNSVLHVLGGTAADSLAAAMRTMSNCFAQALSLLGLPQIE